MSGSDLPIQQRPKSHTKGQTELIAAVATKLDELAPQLLDLGKKQSAMADRAREKQVRDLVTELLKLFSEIPTQFPKLVRARNEGQAERSLRNERPDLREALWHAWYVTDQIRSLMSKHLEPDWKGRRAQAFQLKLCGNTFRRLFPQVDEGLGTLENESPSDFVTLQEVADFIGHAKATLDNWRKANSGKFPAPLRRGKPGQTNRFRWAEFRVYLETERGLGPFDTVFPREEAKENKRRRLRESK